MVKNKVLTENRQKIIGLILRDKAKKDKFND